MPGREVSWLNMSGDCAVDASPLMAVLNICQDVVMIALTIPLGALNVGGLTSKSARPGDGLEQWCSDASPTYQILV